MPERDKRPTPAEKAGVPRTIEEILESMHRLQRRNVEIAKQMEALTEVLKQRAADTAKKPKRK